MILAAVSLEEKFVEATMTAVMLAVVRLNARSLSIRRAHFVDDAVEHVVDALLSDLYCCYYYYYCYYCCYC